MSKIMKPQSNNYDEIKLKHTANLTYLDKGIFQLEEVLCVRPWGAFCLNYLTAELKKKELRPKYWGIHSYFNIN